MSEVSFVVADAEAGQRLDAVVARHARVSRVHAARLIGEGAVRVEGTAAGKSLRVAPGMRITAAVPRSPSAAPQAWDLPIQVIHEDQWLLVVSKPAGLVVHPAPGHDEGTLVNALLARAEKPAGGDPNRPGIVHRLDAGTSGLMVVAKDEQVHARLVEMMAAREVSRTYLTLVAGSPDTDTMTIDAPIGRSPQHRKKMDVVAGGKDARTEVTVLERFAETTLLEARPVTGRTHQIRVHLAAAGHAVIGDAVYGRHRKIAAALGLDRPFLHAFRLAFTHPVTGQQVAFDDPLPDDLEQALMRARG